MTAVELYQILKLEYGSIKEVSDVVNVSVQTTKNVLELGIESQYKESILNVASRKAEEILLEKIGKAKREISEANTRITLYQNLLKDVISIAQPA